MKAFEAKLVEAEVENSQLSRNLTEIESKFGRIVEFYENSNSSSKKKVWIQIRIKKLFESLEEDRIINRVS